MTISELLLVLTSSTAVGQSCRFLLMRHCFFGVHISDANDPTSRGRWRHTCWPSDSRGDRRQPMATPLTSNGRPFDINGPKLGSVRTSFYFNILSAVKRVLTLSALSLFIAISANGGCGEMLSAAEISSTERQHRRRKTVDVQWLCCWNTAILWRRRRGWWRRCRRKRLAVEVKMIRKWWLILRYRSGAWESGH